MNSDSSVIKPKTRIILLCVLAVICLIRLAVMAVVADEVGFKMYIIENGMSISLYVMIIPLLLVAALIYEALRYSGKISGKWGRYAIYTVVAAVFLGTVIYNVPNSRAGDLSCINLRDYTETVELPLLKDISPEDNEELEAWINENPLINDGYAVPNKSDIVENMVMIQQSIPPFVSREANGTLYQNYYNVSTLYCGMKTVLSK